jgi:Cu+-exporting ATPase
MESILVALDETGFDVMLESPPALTTSTTCARIALTHAASTISALLSNKKQKHADQCLLCSADPEASEHDSSGFHAGSSRHNPRVPLAASPPASARIQELPLTSRRDVSGSPADPTAMRELSLSIGGMTCASCANSIARALHDVQGVRDVSISVLSHSGTCTVMSSDLSNKVVEAIEDCGFEAEIVDVRPVLFSSAESTPRADDLTSLEGPYIVLLSVGGMTCASCSNAITDALESLDGVSDAHVNLLSNSASVTLSDRKYESFVLGAIEDIGYEVSSNLSSVGWSKRDFVAIGRRHWS